MRIVKRILLAAAAVVVVCVGLFVLVIGPWPVYGSTDYKTADYYTSALEDIDASVAASTLDAGLKPLQAGWASRDITPPIGTPMAGYSDRKGAPSEGVRDALFVKALALGDGADTVVLVAADMLIVPPNIADLVREQVAQATPLSKDDLLFHASHTHCGPGALAPGLAMKISAGDYDPAIPKMLAGAFTEAIVDAYKNMETAKLAHGAIDAAHLIRNRARQAGVDGTLHYLVTEQEDGDRCVTIRFSAHPTIFGGNMREFSGEFPGEAVRHIEEASGAEAMYLGGALGSMSPRAPEGPDKSSRVRAMGEALGELVLERLKEPQQWRDALEIASATVETNMPSPQMRPAKTWFRLSPMAASVMGVEKTAWLQAARVGDLFLIGMPYDLSGEISRDWQEWAGMFGVNLWPTSFSAAYCGYLSPDEYYNEVDENGNLNYEMGLMNWFGPNAEAYMADLFKHMFRAMGAEDVAVSREAA